MSSQIFWVVILFCWTNRKKVTIFYPWSKTGQNVWLSREMRESWSLWFVPILESKENTIIASKFKAHGNFISDQWYDGYFVAVVDIDLRLVDGLEDNEGRVEIFYNGEWGTVCSDKFDQEDAVVICASLGYRYVTCLNNHKAMSFSKRKWQFQYVLVGELWH